MFALFATTGCGEMPDHDPARVPGMYVDSSLEEYFRDKFTDEKKEGASEKGEFGELTVIIMPPNFPCKKNAPFRCNLEYFSPNVIKIAGQRFFSRGVRFYLNEQNEKNETSTEPGPHGIFIDSTTEDWLRVAFFETKECGEFENGNYEDLAVTFMPPAIPCLSSENGCGGQFWRPNHIKLGVYKSWKHEVLHYLLFLSTGSADPEHRSSLFESCTK